MLGLKLRMQTNIVAIIMYGIFNILYHMSDYVQKVDAW